MWVCKEHQDQEVSAKGTGCAKCAATLEKYYQRKAAIKARRREPREPRERDEE